MNIDLNFPSVGQHALEYAAHGWQVFPARIDGKQKKSFIAGKANGGARWGATTDPNAIQRYWQQFPEALLGVTTGSDSGFFVIDADVATTGGHADDGASVLRGWIKEHGPLPATIEAWTPSGGWHVYFKWPNNLDVRNSESKIALGIDVRGEGGMVLAPPTVKPGGTSAYRWKNPPGFFELAECPEWLLDKIRDTQAPKLSERAMPSGIQIDTGGATAWADKALQDELAALLAAPEGKRNSTLNECAFNLAQIVAGGSLEGDTVKARLRAAAVGIGLEPNEIAQTIESGFQAGIKTPRGPKERGKGEAATSDGQPRPNASEDPIELSHDSLAADIGTRTFDQDAKHVATWGKWLFWTGTRWQIDDQLDHLTQTRAFLRTRASEITSAAERQAEMDPKHADKIRASAAREARTLRSKNTVVAVESLARSNSASVARAASFDESRLLLGTPGGTVDLQTGQLRTAERSDMITKLTACAPAAPGASPERWLTFLHEIFDHDADLVGFMQRAAGYALTGSTKEHKLLFLYGTGRNGKSVFLNTLTQIWGDYSRRAAAEIFLNTQGDKHATGLAGLQGARLVAGSELPVGKTWDESVIKDLTGGDTITARHMRQDFFDFDPQLTLMIAGNNQPSFRGVDEAIRARVVLVPFLVTIPPERRDKDLPDKLAAEGPEILRWAIEGALQWLDQGLNVPAKVAAASTEYMDDEDTLAQFMADETVLDPEGFITTTDLHIRFKFWCEKQGLHPWTLHTLRKELKSRGFQDHRRPYGRGFIGLKAKG